MKLPNLNYMLSVGELRYIQSAYESPENRNPDQLVGSLLSPLQRLSCAVRGRLLLHQQRAQPFYFYILARTRHYDAIFRNAIANGARYIINIGCGSDTRAYRFGEELKNRGVRVLECDQPEAIEVKRRIARSRWPTDLVQYLPIDIQDDFWPELQSWLSNRSSVQMLVLMEGVSPYVDKVAWSRFLAFLARELQPKSRIAYDFKIKGVNDDFGRSERTPEPFRLSMAPEEVAAYHAACGLSVRTLESSADLSLRMVTGGQIHGTRIFQEDALVSLNSTAAS